ncbi:hypothetical protein [Veillonella parvula]|uniref:hypothetical protein n=1 Tax=Veillonella parvula TaxID=29466 RepID=UPI0028F0DB62|nr:hypothetical protein [Veillonella parvula]
MYTVVLIECNGSDNVGCYGSYKTINEARNARNKFEKEQRKFVQDLSDEQFSKFIEEMPVIVKNYSHIMSVSYILQNCCG